MAIIPGYPGSLLDMHHHWHDPNAHAGAPGARVHGFGTPGGGLEFLQFHRNVIVQFHAWYDSLPFGTSPYDTAPFLTAASAAAAVSGWTSIPAAIKDPSVTGWGGVQSAQEARLNTLTPSFASADELGTYIEGGIHGWIHGATAAAFAEPVVGSLHSPQSTYFYGIHGLVDSWWRHWEATQKPWVKDVIDSKHNVKEFIKEQLKEHVKEHVKEHLKELEKFVPEKSPKEVFEGGPPWSIDHGPVINQLSQRLTALETAEKKRAFIREEERPPVGVQTPREGKTPP